MKKYFLITAGVISLLLSACSREDIHQPGRIVHMTTDQDPRLPSLVVNGVPLHLETFGDLSNPVMVFLHGGPGSDYRSMISEAPGNFAGKYPEERQDSGLGLSALQDDYFLIFYDRRGSGLSPRFEPGGVVFDDQVNDLEAIIQHFLAEKNATYQTSESQVYLFGWSFGGYLATAFTNEHPELIKDLIIYEPRPFNQEVFDLMTVTSPFRQLTEDYVDGVFTASTYAIRTDHETADYQWMIGATGDFFPEFHNPEVMPLWRSGFVVNQEIEAELTREDRDIVSNLGDFQGNTLYLFGEFTSRDAVKAGFFEKVSGYFPSITLTEIKGTGHYGPWEESDQVVPAIRAFLAE